MTLAPKTYRSRLVDALLDEYLATFGAVEVCGPRWCGKTWTCLAHAESDTRLDGKSMRELVSADPALALGGDRPHLIDEWQEVPETWDEVRRAVDAAGSEPGQFLLSGSSTPRKLEDRSHSGAGRIARLRMGTLSLFERGESSGAVSLADLFAGRFEPAPAETGLADLARLITRGGWPGSTGLPDGRAARIPRQYLQAVYDVSAPKEGISAAGARRAMRSLSRTVGTSASVATIAADMAQGGKPNEGEARRCLDFFLRSYLVWELDGWDAPVRSRARVRTKAKRYLADPSIACAALGIDAERLLEDSQLLGVLFENLCLHDLGVYLSANEDLADAKLLYYRDDYGLEIDAVIELDDGRWAAIEVKLGENKVADATSNLLRLRDKVASNPQARNPDPAFLAVIVGNTPMAHETPEGVRVLPLTSLAP